MNPETLRDLLLSLHTASAHAAVLGMLVMALRAILGRNLSPGWRCALWLLVIVRLAWPLHLPSPVSLFNLADPRLSTIASSAIPLSAWKWIALVWAAGAMALFVSVLVDRVRMWWMLRDARPMDSWEAWWLWEQCKTESGLRTPVAILESSQVRSPCLLGSLRPKLLLPKGLSDSFSVEEMRLIFLHELAHLRRADLLWNWLMEIVRTAHWFNPVVWIAYRGMREDREEACDADALSLRPGSNQTYGRTLLKFLESMSRAGTGRTSGAFVGFEGDHAPESLVSRIRAIARFSALRRTWIVGSCTFLAVALVGLTDPDSGRNGNGAGVHVAVQAN